MFRLLLNNISPIEDCFKGPYSANAIGDPDWPRWVPRASSALVLLVLVPLERRPAFPIGKQLKQNVLNEPFSQCGPFHEQNLVPKLSGSSSGLHILVFHFQACNIFKWFYDPTTFRLLLNSIITFSDPYSESPAGLLRDPGPPGCPPPVDSSRFLGFGSSVLVPRVLVLLAGPPGFSRCLDLGSSYVGGDGLPNWIP